MTQTLRASQRRDDPAPTRPRRVRRTYSLASSGSAVSAGPFAEGPHRVPDRGPVRPVVGGDLKPVGSRDYGGIAASRDAARGDVLPLGAELIVGPGLPGPASVGRQSPPVADRAVPDLPARAEAEGVHEVPGERAGRGVAPDHLPGAGPLREAVDPLAIGTDPKGTRRVPGGREDVHAPAGAVGHRGRRALRGHAEGKRRGQRGKSEEADHRRVGCVMGAGRPEGCRRIQSTWTCSGRVAAKSTASATSSGRSMVARGGTPGRRSGVNGSQMVVSVAPGETSVSRTPGPVVLRGQRLVQSAEPVLAGGVGGVLRKSRVVGDAADADEDAPAGRSHGGQKGAREQKGGSQVDGELRRRSPPAWSRPAAGAESPRRCSPPPRARPRRRAPVGRGAPPGRRRSGHREDSGRVHWRYRRACAPRARLAHRPPRAPRATAAPIPREAPVTSARRPASGVTPSCGRRAPGGGTRPGSWSRPGRYRAARW